MEIDNYDIIRVYYNYCHVFMQGDWKLKIACPTRMLEYSYLDSDVPACRYRYSRERRWMEDGMGKVSGLSVLKQFESIEEIAPTTLDSETHWRQKGDGSPG